MNLERFYSFLSEQQKNILLPYLNMRFQQRTNRKVFNVVFDVLHHCNLQCIGCGTNAEYTADGISFETQPTFDQIESALTKIKHYSVNKDMPVFVNFGGGEPFLRNDILKILRVAAEYFGVEEVGVDTNATLSNSYEFLCEAMQYVSYVGISINGLETYHNWWAGNPRINGFRNATEVVKKLCENESFKKKLEVTSIATRKNMEEIPALIQYLHEIGVANYSIHRAIPVGRMAKLENLMPSAKEYLLLLLSMIEKSHTTGMNVHLHHSIESIHTTLLLNKDTYCGSLIGNPDFGSSVGIDPEGNLVFDPWCTSGFWKLLAAGNVYSEDSIIDLAGNKDSTLNIVKQYTNSNMRCNGCKYPCSGGSRVVAAAINLNESEKSSIDQSKIFHAMTAIDPACPLYDIDQSLSNKLEEKVL